MTGSILSVQDLSADLEESCDVCIIGSGAGGGVLAAGLVARGVDVVMLEEGGLYGRSDFTLHERDAMPALYQEGGGRTTADQAISVLQGRAVGGGTAVNWTSCFRIPDRILDVWRKDFGIEGLDTQTMLPHYEAVEERLNIREWPLENANANNQVLIRGAGALGWEVGGMRRNVRGCLNTGYCGLGCPVDAKQSGFVTVIPEAVEGGMRLYTRVQAQKLSVSNGRVRSVEARGVPRGEVEATGVAVTVRAKVFVSSCGALNGPALLLRSGILSGGLVGRRTFIHPVVATLGLFEDPIAPWQGAPQSAHSHEFIDRGPDKVGFFLEAAPLHPMLAAMSLKVQGEAHRKFMTQLGHIQVLLSLAVDGVMPGDEGGVVTLKDDGRPQLEYPTGAPLQEVFREGHNAMAQVQLAAGALEVRTTHVSPRVLKKKADLAELEHAPYGGLEHSIFSAHQMGGCPMGGDPARSVVDTDLRHRELPNLFVVDGSVLPTSLGVNPSQTIYSLAHRARAIVAGAV